jgi:release factor glutamine methyltransferase
MSSFLSLVTEGAARLERAGLSPDDSARDVAVLARAVLGWDQAQWLARRQEPASAEFAAAFHSLLTRRAAREPIAYILGEREFYGRPFLVSRDVLIPRPETELVIDQALAWLSTAGRPAAPTIVDVGTGSGCLAVTLALECPAAHLAATDISPAALEVAVANAARHGVAARIEWRHAVLAGDLTAGADLIVANPPYVAERDRALLAPDVRDYEPATALFAGPDGLDVIRPLAPAASRALRPGGALIMEIGAGQWPAVDDILRRAGFQNVAVHADLAGIPRVVVGQATRMEGPTFRSASTRPV